MPTDWQAKKFAKTEEHVCRGLPPHLLSQLKDKWRQRVHCCGTEFWALVQCAYNRMNDPRGIVREIHHPTTQETSLHTHEHYQMVNNDIRLITFFAAEDAQAVYNQQKTRPGRDCGADHQLLIAKFTLKLKKVVKTSKPFRYNLNQIP